MAILSSPLTEKIENTWLGWVATPEEVWHELRCAYEGDKSFDGIKAAPILNIKSKKLISDMEHRPRAARRIQDPGQACSDIANDHTKRLPVELRHAVKANSSRTIETEVLLNVCRGTWTEPCMCDI